MRRALFTIGVLVLFCAISSSAITIHVPVDYSSIQGAITWANNGDTIIVSPGIYQEHINFLGKSIALISQAGPENTIIERSADGTHIVTFDTGEDYSSIIRGFTIRNANGASGISITSSSPIVEHCIIEDNINNSGAGILIRGSISMPIIRLNTIRFNIASIYGGGILVNDSYAKIDSNVIYENIADIGAGVDGHGGSLFMIGNIIYKNTTNDGYAAVYLGSLDNAMVINNTIADNHAPMGSCSAALIISSCTATLIKNNIIAFNDLYGIYNQYSTGNQLLYCCTYGNEAAPYYGIVPGEGCIQSDPLFANMGINDYNLTENSPCIDSADPANPLDPDCTRADMGALYFNQTYRISDFHLIEPPSDSIYLSIPRYFIWQLAVDIDSGYAVNYKFYFDDNPAFDSPDSSAELYDTTCTLPDTLMSSKYYYWKVLAYNYHASPAWSDETWNFYIDGYPMAPIIINPQNGACVDTLTYLTWLVSTDPDTFDAVSYTIQIDEDLLFESPEIDQSGLSSGLMLDDAFAIRLGDLDNIENLVIDTKYYWRVRAHDNFGLSSPWSDSLHWFNYLTQNHPPYPPTSGFSPDGDEEIISLIPTITWNNAVDPDPDDNPGTLRYYFQLIEDTSTGGYMYSDTTEPGINQVAIAEQIPDNSHFMYFVKTVDDEGLESQGSDLHWFWTNHYNYPPEPFPLYLPAPDLRWIDYYTCFRWGRTGDYDPLSSFVFTLQISPDSLFNNYVLTRAGLTDTALTMFTDTLALVGGNLFWRVLAIDDDSLIRVGGLPEPEVRKLTIVKPGDASGDGLVIGGDVTYLVNFFRDAGPAPDPRLAGDTNGDCLLTGNDVTYLVRFFRSEGPAPQRAVCE